MKWRLLLKDFVNDLVNANEKKVYAYFKRDLDRSLSTYV
jgi:hypothetical protein